MGNPTRIVVADPMDGVRAGLRWLLAGCDRIEIVSEAGTVAAAASAPGEVVVAGVRFPDGTAAGLCELARPVVVYTWLPDDERADVDLSAAAAVVRLGDVRAGLVEAILDAGSAVRDPAGGGAPDCADWGRGA